MTESETELGSNGRWLLERLAEHLAACGRRGVRVSPEGGPEALVARWPLDDLEATIPFEELVEHALRDSVAQHHPGYVGHQLSQPLPRAVLLDALASLLNNGMAAFDSGPANSAAELAVVRALARTAGFEAGDGLLTSGGSLGNLTALLAARQAIGGDGIWKEGVREPLAIAAGADAHYSVARAAGIMGLGTDAVIPVPLDTRRRMRPDALAALDAGGRRLFAVVANAGSTATGAFDPLDELADVCAARGLWLHVDGAHGASLLLSERLRERLRGIERASSLVWDAHKMLQVPALSTAVLFRRGADALRAFRQDAPYLWASEDPARLDLGQRTVECTKRGMGLVLYGMLRTMGRAPFARYVERQVEATARFAERVAAAPDFEVAVAPQCNILCFRHLGTDGDLDAHQDAVRARVNAGGRFFLGRTVLDGRTWLRTTVSNPATEDADLDALLDAIRALRTPRSA